MSNRTLSIIVAATLLAGQSPPALAQTSSFRDLALRINVGDRLAVENPSGVTTSGRIVRLTPAEITLDTASGERQFDLNVRSISVRHRSTRKAVLIGAGLGAAVGLVAACTAAEREECGDAGLILGAMGAGGGALVSALRPTWSVVYAEGRATDVSASAGPIGPLDELALRVNLGDRVRVRDRSGASVGGRLTRLTGEEITIRSEAGDTRIPAMAVRAVAVRRYALGEGALVGGVLFTALALAAPACRNNSDCRPLAAAPFGAGVGLAIGALVPRMKTVFRTEEPRISLLPIMARSRTGLRATLRW